MRRRAVLPRGGAGGNLRDAFRGGLVALVLGVAAPAPGWSAFGPPPVRDAAQIRVGLDRVASTATVLYVAAHPDDENTAFLTWLENERHARAAYLSMTRGDGGQNLIGDEKGDLLGVIRTQELLAARRVDNAEQFFSRAIDFGYSKTPDETLALWGRDAVLADMVRVIRTLRPDVIVTRFPTTGEGGHGHHTASAVLALEAFAAAADPKRFPDQLATLDTWQPRRILWNYFTWTAPPTPEEQKAKSLLGVDIGAFSPLLGRAANEVAAESRSMHKSQGFGSAERRGTQMNWFQTLLGPAPAADLFDGIITDWSRFPGGAAIDARLARIRSAFDLTRPAASLPELAALHAELVRLGTTPAGRASLGLIDARRVELEDILRSCAGLWLEAIATKPSYVPGDSLLIRAMAVNRSDATVRLQSVSLLAPETRTVADAALPVNVTKPVDLRTVVPADMSHERTQPYWLRATPGTGLFDVSDPALIGRAENPPVFTARFEVSIAGAVIRYDVPVLHRWVDRVRGEIYQPAVIVPAVAVAPEDGVYLFADATARPVSIRVTARDRRSGIVRLRLPAGWSARPAEAAAELPGRSTPVTVTFQVIPPAGAGSGTLEAEFVSGSETFDEAQSVIDYPHIPVQTLFRPATARLVRLELAKRGATVGYVMGPGDEVPAALRQAGYQVALLSDADLDGADLSGYDAIVTGVRAYNARDGLKARNNRLHDYVRAGGTLVVQYNTSDNTLLSGFAPLPLALGRDRVTVEEAPLRLLLPDDPLLTEPNRITPADFDGWVQERGLYFAATWDSTWRAPLACQDPGEPERNGGLLAARFGRGVVIYTGYAFFRQLPAGVPGAYRLFVNLVSAR